jgi:hypothetical protein
LAGLSFSAHLLPVAIRFGPVRAGRAKLVFFLFFSFFLACLSLLYSRASTQNKWHTADQHRAAKQQGGIEPFYKYFCN